MRALQNQTAVYGVNVANSREKYKWINQSRTSVKNGVRAARITMQHEYTIQRYLPHFAHTTDLIEYSYI